MVKTFIIRFSSVNGSALPLIYPVLVQVFESSLTEKLLSLELTVSAGDKVIGDMLFDGDERKVLANMLSS